MTEKGTILIDLLVKQGLLSAKEKGKSTVTEHKGDVARHPDKLSQRFVVAYDGKPKYSVKFIQKTWSFSPEDILATISTHAQFTSVSVPKLLAHFKSDDGYYFVDEFLPDAVSLDLLIERGSVGTGQALEILRAIFVEVFETGLKPSEPVFASQKQLCLDQTKQLVREGIWGDFILHYVEKAIDDHAGLLKEIYSTGDIIDRNILLSGGKWYLVDFEYSHRTIFGFADAYRNFLYAPWTRSYTLADVYPPLKEFPQDVAAMIAVARERVFQSDVLDDHAREITRQHLRYVFWNLLDPAIITQLDRQVGAKEEQIAQLQSSVNELTRLKQEEIALIRSELLHWQQTVVPEKDKHIANLEEALRLKEDRAGVLQAELLVQQSLLRENERRVNELLQEIKAREADVTQRDALIAEQTGAFRKREQEIGLERQLAQDKEAELNNDVMTRDQRIKELETWGTELWNVSRKKDSTITFQQRSIEELSQRERTLATQLARKEAAYQQQVNEYIYIKSTLSYSVGRIIVFPFELLFNGVIRLFDLIDKVLGPVLWPKGSKRAVVVNAFVHLKQTIATATYLLHVHGFKGFMSGVRQTWHAGANLGLHRNFPYQAPEQSAATTLPVQLQSLAQVPQVEQTGVGVSIVIPVLNESDNLLKLLPVLNSQQGFKTIEVIIVDSGSTDDSVGLAKEYDAKVFSIAPKDFSHSGSRNLGADQATQEYLLFMTADALPTSDIWLYQMYTFLKKESIAAASCMEIPCTDIDLFSRVQQWYHYKYFLELQEGDKVLSLPSSRDPVSMRKHAQLTDVACLIRRSLFLKYRFRYEYGEDLDLGIRLLNDGNRIGLMSSVKVIHSHNRPAYYHLKRGYMDKLVIAKILGERLDQNVYELQEVLSDIEETYTALHDMSVEKLLGQKEQVTVEELRSTVMALMNAVEHSPRTKNVRKSAFVDPQFFTFIQKISKQFSVEQRPEQGTGNIVPGLKQFLEQTFEYLAQTYEKVDATVVNDLVSLIYKHLANLSGVYLALSLSHARNGKGTFVADLRSELEDGKIRWVEKAGAEARIPG